MKSTTEERLQKVLARAGVASRRKAEELITAGRVEVNGKVARELGLSYPTLLGRIKSYRLEASDS